MQTDMDDMTLLWLVGPFWKYRCGTSHHEYGHPSVTWTRLGAQQTSIKWSEASEPVLTMTLMFCGTGRLWISGSAALPGHVALVAAGGMAASGGFKIVCEKVRWEAKGHQTLNSLVDTTNSAEGRIVDDMSGQ